MHSAALLWATVLASGGGSHSESVSSSSTLPVAIVGGISLIVVALIPEFFRWLRRHAAHVEPASGVTPNALQAAEQRISSVVDVKLATVLERANSARAEVRALRKAMESRDEQLRDDLDKVRDQLNEHLWNAERDERDRRDTGPVPMPREPGQLA